jgi:hypothetical protein
MRRSVRAFGAAAEALDVLADAIGVEAAVGARPRHQE